MRSVTKQAVKEARLKEIKQELLNSEKLKVNAHICTSNKKYGHHFPMLKKNSSY